MPSKPISQIIRNLKEEKDLYQVEAGRIQIARRESKRRGEDGSRVISVRLKVETVARLDALAFETNRSRNEIIRILLAHSLQWAQITAYETGHGPIAGKAAPDVNVKPARK